MSRWAWSFGRLVPVHPSGLSSSGSHLGGYLKYTIRTSGRKRHLAGHLERYTVRPYRQCERV